MEREGEHGKVPRSSSHWARDSALTSPQRRGRGALHVVHAVHGKVPRFYWWPPQQTRTSGNIRFPFPFPIPFPFSTSSLPLTASGEHRATVPVACTEGKCAWGGEGGVRSHGSMRTWDAHAAASTHEFRVESGERARAQGEEKIGRG